VGLRLDIEADGLRGIARQLELVAEEPAALERRTVADLAIVVVGRSPVDLAEEISQMRDRQRDWVQRGSGLRLAAPRGVPRRPR
jgi:hypothetical protein